MSDDLTEAGRQVRARMTEPNDQRAPGDPVRTKPGYVPCAQEHEPGRVCILPDGHPEVDAMSVPDHLARTRRALDAVHNAVGGSSYGMGGRIADLMVRLEAELVSIEHKARLPEADPTVPLALAVGRLRDRYKADGVPEPRQVIADLTGALTYVVGPSLLADHDERVMRRLLAYIAAHHADGAIRTWAENLSNNLPPEVFRG